jgi:hypothetical protein
MTQHTPQRLKDRSAGHGRLLSTLGWRALGPWSVVLALSGCGSSPAVPDWQLDAHGALEQATQATLRGEQREADAAFARARKSISSSGRIDLLARAELTRCAAWLASLQPPPSGAGVAAQLGSCPGFEPLREDAGEAERAYADFLAGRLSPARAASLPPSQQAAWRVRSDTQQREAAIRAIEDPLSRLVATAAALRDAMLPPGLAEMAVQTASTQGWRRPLLAWLGVQRARAEAAGDTDTAAALARRMAWVADNKPSGP